MKPAFLNSYPEHFARLQSLFQGNTLFSQAVGGNFLASGKLQYSLLVHLGLTPESRVIDIGCGSGRLASQLAHIAGLKYTGTDVVPQLLDHARQICNRTDWKFLLTDGTAVPAEDNTVDFACFFSVFTHLRHEESYRYLEQTKKALRPGGLIVFSFLEFKIHSHWAVFDHMIQHSRPESPLNQFMDRDGIAQFARYLDLEVQQIWDGGIPHIPFEGEVVWDDGRKQTGLGDIGHSVCVLRKKSD
jgi:SAM-dependent methyltransferase